jgi:hypothetical protein
LIVEDAPLVEHVRVGSGSRAAAGRPAVPRRTCRSKSQRASPLHVRGDQSPVSPSPDCRRSAGASRLLTAGDANVAAHRRLLEAGATARHGCGAPSDARPYRRGRRSGGRVGRRGAPAFCRGCRFYSRAFCRSGGTHERAATAPFADRPGRREDDGATALASAVRTARRLSIQARLWGSSDVRLTSPAIKCAGGRMVMGVARRLAGAQRVAAHHWLGRPRWRVSGSRRKQSLMATRRARG